MRHETCRSGASPGRATRTAASRWARRRYRCAARAVHARPGSACQLWAAQAGVLAFAPVRRGACMPPVDALPPAFLAFLPEAAPPFLPRLCSPSAMTTPAMRADTGHLSGTRRVTNFSALAPTHTLNPTFLHARAAAQLCAATPRCAAQRPAGTAPAQTQCHALHLLPTALGPLNPLLAAAGLPVPGGGPLLTGGPSRHSNPSSRSSCMALGPNPLRPGASAKAAAELRLARFGSIRAAVTWLNARPWANSPVPSSTRRRFPTSYQPFSGTPPSPISLTP